MRRWLPLLALLAAVPSQAQEAPVWVGVWEGRVGDQPVRACLDSWGEGTGHGSYYYLRYLEPITLAEDGEEGGWVEYAPASDAEAYWDFTELTARRARGTWRQGERRVPFSLTPVEWADNGWGGACGSTAFLEARVVPGEIVAQQAEFEGLKYTRHIYRPPPHFAEDVSIELFTYEGEEPGDFLIEGTLAQFLPTGTFDDPHIDCLASNISATGSDGFYEQTLRPTLVTQQFLGFEESSATYCGGAHPNYFTVARTFDRQSGEEIDLMGWLSGPVHDDDPAISDALKALAIARWPVDSDTECRDYAAEAEFWSLGLSRAGLVFRPDLPHAATPCEEAITVEWDALAPFLSRDGRAGLARLRGG